MNKGYLQLINHRRKSGVMLYKSGNVIMREGNQFKVRSESDSSIEYDTTLDSCTCGDHLKRGNSFVCKHRCALLLQLGLENEENFILNADMI